MPPDDRGTPRAGRLTRIGALMADAVDVAAHTATMRAADLAFQRMGFADRIAAAALQELSAAWAAYLSAYELSVNREPMGTGADLHRIVELRRRLLHLTYDRAAVNVGDELVAQTPDPVYRVADFPGRPWAVRPDMRSSGRRPPRTICPGCRMPLPRTWARSTSTFGRRSRPRRCRVTLCRRQMSSCWPASILSGLPSSSDPGFYCGCAFLMVWPSTCPHTPASCRLACGSGSARRRTPFCCPSSGCPRLR